MRDCDRPGGGGAGESVRIRLNTGVRYSGSGPRPRTKEKLLHHIANVYGKKLSESEVNGRLQKLIAQGTDWRFLNELKKELKA